MQSAARKRTIDVQAEPMKADVYDITTRKRQPMPLSDFLEMLDTLQKYIEEARKQKGDKDAYRKSESLLKVIRFNAYFNFHFREGSRDALREVLDIMYEDIHK